MTGEEEPIYPNLIAEIPGVELEINFEDIEDAVQETRAYSLADQAADPAWNANLYKTIGEDSKTAGVYRAPNSFNLKHEVEDDIGVDDFPPKMEVDYDSDDTNDSEDKPDNPLYRGCHHSQEKVTMMMMLMILWKRMYEMMMRM